MAINSAIEFVTGTKRIFIPSPTVQVTNQDILDSANNYLDEIGLLGIPNFVSAGGREAIAGGNVGLTLSIFGGWTVEWEAEAGPALTQKTILGNVAAFVDSSLAVPADIFTPTANVFPLISQSFAPTASDADKPLLQDIHGQIRRGIFIDTELGVNGNGYQQTPFNNWTDGVDFAEADNLKDLFVVSDATVDRQLKNFTISGIGLPTIDLNAQNMDKTIFRLCGLTGSYTGDINAIECSLINLSGLNGVLFTVNASGVLQVAPGGNVTLWNVKQAFAGEGWSLDMNTGTTSKAAVHESVGDVTIVNMDDAADLLEYNGDGTITFDASCVAGTARITGDAIVSDNSGPLCNVIDMTNSKRVREMHTRLQLEKGNAWTDTPSQSGDASGDIVIDNTGDGENTSTGTRQ